MDSPISNIHSGSKNVTEQEVQSGAIKKATEQSQPWTKYIEEINKLNAENPLDKEFFECAEGFNDHSVAG